MTARPTAATALLAHFRRQRPLRGGSLIITVFGDAIAPRGGAITLRSLIGLMAPFGLTERLVRTSVARLATDEWLTSRRVGRLSEYCLAPPGRQRFLDATRRIYSGPSPDWAGRWTLVLMPGVSAAQRHQAREALRWEGFGEPIPGVLAHPSLTPAEARIHLNAAHLANQAIILESRAFDPGDQRLIDAGWDLRELAAGYQRFIEQFEPVATRVRSPISPQDAFLLRTLLIHEYRKIHLRDPMLPSSLLPSRWPGTAAYELCRSVYAQVLAAAEAHLTGATARLEGSLPAADSGLARRFAIAPPG